MEHFQKIQEAADHFVQLMGCFQKDFAVGRSAIPTLEQKRFAAQAFWNIWGSVGDYVETNPPSDFAEERRALMSKIGPILWQCQHYAQSYFKPHGMSGDYRIVEMMYDLEFGAGDNPFQPAIVNCLEYCFSTIHSVVGIWDRRKWIAQHVKESIGKVPTLQVLDVPCGGARYLTDVLAKGEWHHGLHFWLMDQDPSAIAFVRYRALAKWPQLVTTLQSNIVNLGRALKGKKFDIIISAGMFDYLQEGLARRIIKIFERHLAPGGKVLLTNYHKSDPSRICKDWGANWALIFREEEELKGLFPPHWEVKVSYSNNKCLMMCEATPVNP